MRRTLILLAAAAAMVASGSSTLAQPPAPTAPPPPVSPEGLEKMERMINTVPDTPGTGRFPALKEEVVSLPDHTVYRPADLSKIRAGTLGVVAWGNGGCMNDGAFTRFHLSELASHGYLVIANGRILSGPGKPPLNLRQMRPPGPPPASAGGPPPPLTTPAQLVQAIDWALAENKRQGSALFGKIDPQAIAVSGGSCGGLQALQIAASDPRVRTAIIHNSGIFADRPSLPGLAVDKTALDRLHAPILYVLGGPSDIAYSNGMDDFARITRVPAAAVNHGDVGHGGSFFDENGGKGAKVAVAWLNWQLKGDAAAAKMFLGRDCGLCRDPELKLQTKGFATATKPVRTETGVVQGVAAEGIASYKAIPFAAPPVGPLRWKPPAPVKPWTGMRQASAFAPACIQNTDMFVTMGQPRLDTSEDCLYLNVWSPAKEPGERLPVMVWIHGGAFNTGSPSTPMFDGTKLASRGVIVVTVAYRLGAFGFLAHPALSAESATRSSGLYGIMDQVAGLKWVKRNIAAFGGDPAKVTLFGESAGAMSVSALAAAPEAKGLFRAVIAQSGAHFPAKSIAPGLPGSAPRLADAEAKGAELLGKLGAASIADARKAPAADVLRAAESLGNRFTPVPDDRFVVRDQYAAYAAGRYNRTPALIGFNSDEGALFVQSMTSAQFKAMVEAEYGSRAPQILEAYPAGSDEEALASARRLFGDRSFGWPIWTWARLQLRSGGKKLFGYYLDHAVPHPDIPLFRGVEGAFHGADLAYVFGVPTPGWRPEDQRLSDLIIDYWTNFAKTGDPNGPGLARWQALDPASMKVMRLKQPPGMIDFPNRDRLRLFGE